MPRSAVSPTISGGTAPARRAPSDRLDGGKGLVRRFVLAHARGAALSHSPPRAPARPQGRPLAGVDANEMSLLAALQRGYALARNGPQHDGVGPAPDGPRLVQSGDVRSDVVAVDLLRGPAKGAPFVGDRLHVEHDSAIRLDAVAVDQRDQVVEPEARTGHRGLPGRALLHLAVRNFAEDSCRRFGKPEAERHADRLPEALAERAADDLDARRRVERAHLQATAVGTVSCELIERDDAAFRQHRPKRDRVVAG